MTRLDSQNKSTSDGRPVLSLIKVTSTAGNGRSGGIGNPNGNAGSNGSDGRSGFGGYDGSKGTVTFIRVSSVQ